MTERDNRRSDAVRNRDRILAAARTAFAATPDPSLNAIAKAAGVGSGTLYRHFPTRETLVLALYQQEIATLIDLAPALAAAHAPLDAIRLWLNRLAYYGRIKLGLADVLHAAHNAGVVGEAYRPMVGAIDLLLRVAERAGAIRPGTDAEDLLLLVGFLWRVEPGTAGEARAARLLDLVVDALTTGCPR